MTREDINTVDDLIKSTRAEVVWSSLYWDLIHGDLTTGKDASEKIALVAKIFKSLGSCDHRDILVFSEHYYVDLSKKQPIECFQ